MDINEALKALKPLGTPVVQKAFERLEDVLAAAKSAGQAVQEATVAKAKLDEEVARLRQDQIDLVKLNADAAAKLAAVRSELEALRTKLS